MKPSLGLHALIKHTNWCCQLMGLDLMTPKMEYVPRTWMTVFVPVSYTIFGFYWSYKQMQIHWMEGLKSSVMYGGLINGCCELATVFYRHSDVKHLMNYIIDLYADYEQRGAVYCDALHLGVNRMLNIRRVIRIGYFVSFVVMLSLPGILLVYDGSRVTVMQYEIPGLPLGTNYGYTLTYLHHLLCVGVAGLGFYTGDLMVLLALIQILTFAHLLQLKTDALNDALHRKEQSRYESNVGAFTDTGIDALLFDTIKFHQVFIDYCQKVESTYDLMIAGQVLSSAVAILICFCVNLSGFHLISTIYLVVSAYSMVVYCLVGTQIEYAYDRVFEAICNISWYELNGDQRKLFALMLKKSQNMPVIIMLGIMPLSVRTALQISKLIYSISMMMMQ